MSAETRASLLDQVSVWGHNVGAGGMPEILRSSLRENGSLLTSGRVTDFLKATGPHAVRWHQSNGLKPARTAEASSFWLKTVNDLGDVERKVNGRCGVY